MTSPSRGAFLKYHLSLALPALQCHATTISITKPSRKDIFLKSTVTSAIRDVPFSPDFLRMVLCHLLHTLKSVEHINFSVSLLEHYVARKGSWSHSSC